MGSGCQTHCPKFFYFLTQVFVVASHFISFTFLHSAFVFGGAASSAKATTGVEKANKIPS